MKIVSHKETGELLEIDETVEKDYMSKYNHRSGQPFEGAKTVEQLSTEELEKIANEHGMTLQVTDTDIEESEESIESLRARYEEANGKPVSNRYKNDREWILSRI